MRTVRLAVFAAVLLMLPSAAHSQATATSRTVPEIRECTVGNSGGGSRLSSHASLVHAVTLLGDSARIDAVFIARGEGQIPAKSELPPVPELSVSAAGASAGRWYLRYDREGRTAWIDDVPVEVGDDNVLLLHGVDSMEQPPQVVATLRIPAMFYTGGCRDGRRWSDYMMEYVLRVPEIRAFVDEGR